MTMVSAMKTEMATKRPKQSGWKFGERCTEFQLHKSQLSLASVKYIIDYSEVRLKHFIKTVSDAQQKETLTKVLNSYKRGEVAVAWKAGKPVWINVTKE